MVFVPNVCHASAHAGGEVSPGFAQHDHASAGHVFAAVVSHTFHDGDGSGVAYGEPFAGPAVDIDLAARGTVEQRVARNCVLFRIEVGAYGRSHGNQSAAQPFAQVVVRLAFQFEADAVGQKRPEALSGGTFEFHVDGLFGQPFVAIPCGHGTRQHGSYGAIGIGDGVFQGYFLAMFEGFCG